MSLTVPIRACCALAVSALAIAGCSTRQWYGAGQAWQQGECQREVNEADYRRCVASANVRFDDYVREREADRRAGGGSSP